MARKGLLNSVLNTKPDAAQKENRADYAMRGASRSMKLSIDDMAENAKRMAEGETVLNINPDLIDGSFVKDRLTGDDEKFEALKHSIAEYGQESPALVRPHPNVSGRYMIVFGHRRVRVAKALGRDVKAIVKSMEEVGHVIAQGQENTARENLSFIEKALFAKKLIDMDQSRDTVMAALSVDATLLSRMLSVSQKIPLRFIESIGAAKSIGRDRWEELKKLIVVPHNTKRADALIEHAQFLDAHSDERFELLLKELQKKGAAPRKIKDKSGVPVKKVWQASDGRLKVAHGSSGKAYSISLTAADAADFGDYLAKNLDELYQAYRAKQTGDNE